MFEYICIPTASRSPHSRTPTTPTAICHTHSLSLSCAAKMLNYEKSQVTVALLPAK